MDHKTTYIIVAAVAILVVAGAAFALTSGGDDEEVLPDTSIDYPAKDPSAYRTAGLPVFGNADGNQVIDANDVKIIKNIIKGADGYNIDKYPFADANFDQKINADDVALVEKIIAKESVKIHHLNYMNDTGLNTKIYIKDAMWPAANAIVAYSSNLTTIKALGLESKVCASPDKGPGGYFDQELLGYLNNDDIMHIDLWGGASVIDQVNHVVDEKKTHTIFVPGYPHEWADEPNIEKATGCDIIRLCESNPSMDDVYASILLMAFMFDEVEKGQALADLSKETWEGVEKLAAGIAEKDKVEFACGLSAENNQHTQKCIMAGGIYGFKDCGQTPSAYGGLPYGDWLFKPENNVDCWLEISWSNVKMGSFFDKDGPNAKAILDSMADPKKDLTKLDVYKNGDFDFVYAGIPIAFDPLCRGYAMYPDVYGAFYESQLDKLFVMLGENPAGEKFADLDLDLVISLADMKKLAEKA